MPSFNYLREREGEAVASGELRERVDPGAVGYDSVESFWANTLRGSGDRENALVAMGVENLGNGRYRYEGE